MGNVYDHAMLYRKKYPGGIAWRIRKHSEVAEKHINPGEKVKYVFVGQKNENFYEWFNTCVVVLTNKRLIIAQKRAVWGYFFSSVTPDLYNDLQVYSGLIWGTLTIDTVKEKIIISNLDKNSLDEIETELSEFMMMEKQKYSKHDKE